MGEENKIEYERVDKDRDKFKRVLVKVNPHFLRSADIEIEFIPLEDAITLGKIFVSEVDTMSSIDLYCWCVRHLSLTQGIGGWDHGYIPPIKSNYSYAKDHLELLRMGEDVIEPRQITGRVKRVQKAGEENYSVPTAFAINYFLETGRLGSLPYGNPYFTIEKLKNMIEKNPFLYHNSSGEVVERSFVPHLIDVHKTGYVLGCLCNFLETMKRLREEVLREHNKEIQWP